MAKVLIIESDEGIRYLYKVAIDFQKMEVTEAESLEKGIEKLKHEKYDLILLDIMTSDFANLNIFEELKKAKDSIPIVIVSDLRNSSQMQRASVIEAYDYLVKSENSVGDIIKRIRSIVSQ